jgi:hypothetical protein
MAKYMRHVTAFYAFFFSLFYFSSARAVLRIMFLKVVLQNKKESVTHINQRQNSSFTYFNLKNFEDRTKPTNQTCMQKDMNEG